MLRYNTSLIEIKLGYHKIKSLAKKCLINKNYKLFLKYLDRCVTLASQINWRYCDEELEEMLFSYAQSIVYNRIENTDYQPDPDRWVFYDDYCTSYVLALQWMTALTKLNKRILYITSQHSSEKRKDISILPVIAQMPNVTVEIVPDGDQIKRANILYQLIIRFHASKLFLHKAMYSLVNTPLCILPDRIQIYNINLEFRPFGASLSLQKRRLTKDQLLMIPFYPANENRPFQGFPTICNNHIVIFSGGDYYKTIDRKHTYWDLISTLLKNHQNVVFLFATKRGKNCNKQIESFIQKNQLDGRFCYINYRQDIFQVFAHCDIYMGTTPVSGSLMSQLAAINRKPILQYYPRGTQDDETEQALCINSSFQISFSNKRDLIKEADRLITDIEYRSRQGNRIAESMISELQFNELVQDTVLTNTCQRTYSISHINNRRIVKRWLYQCNHQNSNIGNFIYSIIGAKNCALFIPSLFLKKNISRVINRIMGK